VEGKNDSKGDPEESSSSDPVLEKVGDAQKKAWNWEEKNVEKYFSGICLRGAVWPSEGSPPPRNHFPIRERKIRNRQ